MAVSANADKKHKHIFGLHPNVFFLGIVSFFQDVSSEMMYTLLPLFLVTLKVTTPMIGFIAGFTEGTDAVFRVFSGWFSDRIRNRKYLTVLGYTIPTLAKPFMYWASNWPSVLAIRFSDRVGKGIRSSPRDALIADSSPANERGKSFGVHRAMDSAGAFVGLGIAAAIVYALEKTGMELTIPTYQTLVLAALIPAVLGVLVLLALVHEPTTRTAQNNTRPRLSLRGMTDGFDSRFKIFLVIMIIFTLGNSSDFFIILRAQNLGSSVFTITLMLVLFNIVYTLVSSPAGVLSDKIGRRRIIIIGWSIYSLVYLGFAVTSSTSSIWQVWTLFAIYGIYYGMVEGVGRAFVADLVPPEKRGIAYGLYQSAIGFSLLAASVIAGGLWQVISPAAPFYFGASMAFLAMLGIWTLVKEKPRAY
ncbi:MAG: MFS transporter [Chloroflexi bacterium]|nr:MFS transporter [Chloroflexota bacterium]MBI4267940.1 MFS transporter [Chloroflexota bacterium]